MKRPLNWKPGVEMAWTASSHAVWTPPADVIGGGGQIQAHRFNSTSYNAGYTDVDDINTRSCDFRSSLLQPARN
jgi:hypothetical protein